VSGWGWLRDMLGRDVAVMEVVTGRLALQIWRGGLSSDMAMRGSAV
jgi:hypothetical protein